MGDKRLFFFQVLAAIGIQNQLAGVNLESEVLIKRNKQYI